MHERETDEDEMPAALHDEGSPYVALTFRRYQHRARATAGHHATMAAEVTNWTLGLAGEAGEVANDVKKHVFHGHPLDAGHIKDECSDVLWYLAMLCHAVGLDLEDVARHNLKKLEKRYPEGFSAERSLNREDE